MKIGGGKSKGNNFEREIARKISLWLSENKDKDLIWRSKSSGGSFTKGYVKETQYGDLAIQKHTGKYVRVAKQFINTFCIEIKFWKKLDLSKISETNDIWKWWVQCENNCLNIKVNPILIAKGNNKPILVFLKNLKIVDLLISKDIYFYIIYGRNISLVVFNFSDLLKLKWREFFDNFKEIK